ncbi:hypothetical protein [Halomicrococcus sp. NG-SE-24]|uniref:hypothetical protein n=1 Tax=Halomicrococcus sp. NG-SE-24 TaxID=3436928 RepID=UPI003D969EEB
MGDRIQDRDCRESAESERAPDRDVPRPQVPDTADNRLVDRRDPVDRSQSGLVSRDYQPRRGGPELVASWPLGTPPRQSRPGNVDWKVESEEFVQLQRNLTVNHFLGPVEFTKLYVGVRGRGRVEGDGTLALRLEPIHLEGEEYRTTVELADGSDAPFVTPMVEFTPDAPDYRQHTFIGREMYGGYVLSARAIDGTGYLDQGTAVHLWSE